MLKGTREQLDATIPLVNKYIDQIRRSFVSETIINKEQCHILQLMMRKANFDKKYDVSIKKFGGKSMSAKKRGDN